MMDIDDVGFPPVCELGGRIPCSSVASLAAHTAPKTAVPNDPPIERKNVAPLVAVPMLRAGTAFWTARMSTCIMLPNPAPNTNIAIEICQYGVFAPSCDSRKSAIVANADPMMGKIL